MDVYIRNKTVLFFLFSGLVYFSWITPSLTGDKERPVTESAEILKGVIDKVSPADSAVASHGSPGSFMLFEDADTLSPGQVIIHVLPTTKIIVGQEEGSTPVGFNTLHAGDQVEVTISGGRMMLSYPPQVTAVEVLVIKSAKP